MGRGQPQHVEQAEHVHVEIAPGLGIRQLFQGPELPVASVVDHYVEAAEGLDGFGQGLAHAFLAAEVHLQGQKPAGHGRHGALQLG